MFMLDSSVKVNKEAVKEGKIAASMLGMNLKEYLTGALRAAAKVDIERATKARETGRAIPEAAWSEVVGPIERKPYNPWRGVEERAERDAEIVRLRREGWLCQAIADKIGVSIGTVANVIRRAKIHESVGQGNE